MSGAPGDWASVKTSARDGEPDRYLAALLAPAAVQKDLIVAAAFVAEIKHAVAAASDPMIGAIRLQWWRDAFADPTLRSGHPVADAVASLIETGRFSSAIVGDVVNAGDQGIGDDRDAGLDVLASRHIIIEHAGFSLAAHVAGADVADGLLDDAARAYGCALAARSAAHEREDWQPFAAQSRRHLDAIRPRHRALSAPAKLVFLPLALVEPYLRALERRDDAAKNYASKDYGAGVSPLVRWWRVARAHWSGRI